MKTAAIYLRQSVTKGSAEDSTSLAVQEDQCRAWCVANGYAVVGVFSDPDTSGAKVATVDRPGWRAMLATTHQAVVVYKFDRLSRDEADSAVTRGALAAQGKRLVSATEGEDPMTAGILSVVAAQFSRQHAERTSLARAKNLATGRAVGGSVPYGYKRMPNPAGPGYVYVQDPAEIEYVKGMVERARRGDTVHSIRLWLNAVGAPPRRAASWTTWTTVSRILHHPFLFGGTPYNPGAGGQTKTRGAGLLTDERGRVVIRPELAVMSRADWTTMVARLDADDTPQNRPYAARVHTSNLLSGLVYCGPCGDGLDSQRRMWRGTINGRPGFSCPDCHMSISNFEDTVIAEMLRVWGDTPRMHRVEVADAGGAEEVASLTLDIKALQAKQAATDDDAEDDALHAQIKALKAQRAKARERQPVLSWTWEPTGQTYREAWETADGERERRLVVEDVLTRITVLKGRPGRRGPAAVLQRLLIDWKPDESWLM